MDIKIIIYLFIIFLGSSVFFTAASSFDYNSYPQDSTNSLIPDSIKLADGKKLYKSKCSRCHTLYKPKDYRLELWKENLDDMKIKAVLSNEEYELILAYLKKYCKK